MLFLGTHDASSFNIIMAMLHGCCTALYTMATIATSYDYRRFYSYHSEYSDGYCYLLAVRLLALAFLAMLGLPEHTKVTRF